MSKSSCNGNLVQCIFYLDVNLFRDLPSYLLRNVCIDLLFRSQKQVSRRRTSRKKNPRAKGEKKKCPSKCPESAPAAPKMWIIQQFYLVFRWVWVKSKKKKSLIYVNSFSLWLKLYFGSFIPFFVHFKSILLSLGSLTWFILDFSLDFFINDITTVLSTDTLHTFDCNSR